MSLFFFCKTDVQLLEYVSGWDNVMCHDIEYILLQDSLKRHKHEEESLGGKNIQEEQNTSECAVIEKKKTFVVETVPLFITSLCH